MTDFRQRLYEQGYTEFRRKRLAEGRSNRESYFRWLDHKVWPLIRDVPADSRILELGCGEGDFLEYLRRKGFRNALGVDRAEEQVTAAQSSGLNARAADAFEFLSTTEGGFELVAAFDFIEHFTVGELLELLPLMRRALRPGGSLLVQTPNAEGLFGAHVVYGDLTHVAAFTPRSLEQLLSSAGFADIRFAECGPAAKSMSGVLRLGAWKTVRVVANAVRLIEIGTTQRIWTENMLCVANSTRSPSEEDDRGDDE